MSFEISPTYDEHSPFSPALSSTVAISSMNPCYLESFPKGQNNGISAALNTSDWIDYFTYRNVIPSLRVLFTISTD